MGRKNIKVNNFNYIKCDINDYITIEKFFNKINPEYLIHLAWDIKDLESNYHFNLLASSINILNSFYKNAGKKLYMLAVVLNTNLKNYLLKNQMS
nr:hypothetical protein [Brachyspira pilosicoli]